MKKILIGILVLSTLFISGYTTYHINDTYTAQLFSDDGRILFLEENNKEDLDNEVNKHLQVGWYVEPRVKLYSLTKEEYVNQSQVEEQLTVGWYLEPVTLLYAEDGRTEVCLNSKVEEQLTVGWYRTKEEAEASRYNKYNCDSEDMHERAKYIYYYLKSNGFSNNGIAAILGNMQQESSIRKFTGSSCGYGLIQWTGSRKKNLFNKSNTSSPSVKNQLDFLIYELQNGYVDLYNHLIRGDLSVMDLTVKFEKEVERAGKPCLSNRKKYASNWYNEMQSW